MMKKIWAVLLSVCLILSLTAPALAAPIKTSGAASTLKLESVDGTAQLKNASGKEVKTTKGARLYNGYKLATEKASYAYVSLDDAKAIKLDASSSSEVFQSGKKLELKVTSGQMFFNVTTPLKSDESLNIRTSTMVTGVRGTSGWVSVIDRFTTQVSLLEGELTVTSTDPLTGTQRTITIVGGQTATIVYHGKDKNYTSEIIIEDKTIRDLISDGTISDEHIVITDTGLTVETLQEEDVPGFVAMEVKKDKELQKKIEENSPLSVPAIIDNADERLEKEEAAAEAADKAIQGEFEKLTADDVDPLFEKATASGGTSSGGGASGSGGGGNSGGNTGSDTPNDPPEIEITACLLIVKHLNTNGESIADDENITFEENSEYSVSPRTDIAGYQFKEWSQDGDAPEGIMNREKTVIFIYEPLEEGGDDTGDETISYNLAVIEQIYDPTNKTTSETNTELNPGGEIAEDVPFRINAPGGYVIQDVLGDNIITITYINNRASADITINHDTQITVVYEPVSNDPAYTHTLPDPTTAQLNELITVYNNRFQEEFGVTDDELESNASAFPTIMFNISGTITMEGDIDTVSFPANYIVNFSDATTLNNGITLNTSVGTQLNVNDGTFTNDGIIVNNGALRVSGSVITSTTIQNHGTMIVSGSVTGTGFAETETETGTPCTIENTGDLTIAGGSVNLRETVGCAILASGGTVTVKSGSVTGTQYGINSPSESGGIINIEGGSISANTAISVTGAVNMSGGTVNGSLAGIVDGGTSGANISVTGGTISVTGDGAAAIQSGNPNAKISVSAPAQINATSSTAGGEAYGIVNSCTSYNSGEYCSIAINGGTSYIPTDNQNTFAVDDPLITAKTADIIFMLQS